MSFCKKDPSNAIRNEVRDFANANGLTFLPKRTLGLLRTLMLRTTGRDHGIDSVFLKTIKPIELILDHLREIPANYITTIRCE
jgi:23S rRNA (uracil1939-C5)-methyltransferase